MLQKDSLGIRERARLASSAVGGLGSKGQKMRLKTHSRLLYDLIDGMICVRKALLMKLGRMHGVEEVVDLSIEILCHVYQNSPVQGKHAVNVSRLSRTAEIYRHRPT